MWLWRYLKSRKVDPVVGIRNYGVVAHQRLYRGAAPDGDGLEQLAAIVGVRTVVDLRDELSTNENVCAARRANQAGIRRLTLPMSDKRSVPDDVVPRWLEIVRDERLWPVFVHCEGGRHRTGVLVAIYRIYVDGWTFDQAYEEMKRYGWYSARGHAPLLEAVRDFAAAVEPR